MISWLLPVLRALTGMARSPASLATENAALRHQLSVLQRERPRPCLRPVDRVLWIWLCRHHINLIRRISSDHPEWGEDRIALELKVELGVKQRTGAANPFGSVPRSLVHDNDGIFGQFGGRRPGRSGRLYCSALDLWLGEVLCIEGIPECGPGLPRETRPATEDGPIRFVARPVLGGLHHDYRLAA